mmetsp:Transcript_69880/g.134811  ORF Transcript_69880/g.134811 Transcript_69880/m.134811 type:complete len:277 (+) Transcript_69880:557-1387(+)
MLTKLIFPCPGTMYRVCAIQGHNAQRAPLPRTTFAPALSSALAAAFARRPVTILCPLLLALSVGNPLPRCCGSRCLWRSSALPVRPSACHEPAAFFVKRLLLDSSGYSSLGLFALALSSRHWIVQFLLELCQLFFQPLSAIFIEWSLIILVVLAIKILTCWPGYDKARPISNLFHLLLCEKPGGTVEGLCKVIHLRLFSFGKCLPEGSHTEHSEGFHTLECCSGLVHCWDSAKDLRDSCHINISIKQLSLHRNTLHRPRSCTRPCGVNFKKNRGSH